jgi:hypothetical protein
LSDPSIVRSQHYLEDRIVGLKSIAIGNQVRCFDAWIMYAGVELTILSPQTKYQ